MNGFTIYKEYYELITLLTEREQQELLLAITKFMFEDVEPTLNDKQTKIFNNLRRPLEKSKKRSKCGSITKSNENQEENETKTKENQKEIKIKSNENQKENESKTHQDVNVNKITLAEIKGIIEYLNIKSNSHYKYSTDKTQTLIKARIKDGFTLDDFKIVIDKNVYSFNSSCFLGLFGKSIRELGENKFREKYQFECTDLIRMNIEDGINDATNNVDTLR